MHGHGQLPPPRHRPTQGVQITLRVVFVALAVLSCGFLAWPALLRLAVTTRRRLDWILFTAKVVLDIVVITLLVQDPGEEEFTTWRGNVGMGILLVGLLVVVAYYLAADIRHYSRPATGAYAPATGYTQPQGGYGYPGPHPQPYNATTVPTPQASAPSPPPSQPSAPFTPAVPPGPQPPAPGRPAPARIDQVRAELDELSDYLRKQDGGMHSGGIRDGGPAGGAPQEGGMPGGGPQGGFRPEGGR
ncbi:hypothetical protein [Streptomyces himalayensis]|uniref:hypothetical protein n=1 Tax=Streptomyces himalayensis TaxID=2820085 RepID=UPI00215DA90A|nr:hypothetical protein [Streptomyces himalayensis]